MALTEIAGPAYATSAANAVTTASFTPAAGGLLVAMASMGNGGGVTATAMTVTDSSGSGSWRLLAGTTLTFHGYAGIWVRDAWTGSGTVTFTGTPSLLTGVSLQIRQFTGAAAASLQAGATALRNSTSGLTLAITPGTTGSQVVGAFGTDASPIVLTANAATSIYAQNDTIDPAGSTIAAFKTAALSTGGTPVTPGFTNTAVVSTIAVAEIVPVVLRTGTAALSGAGTLTGAGVFAAAVALSGSGTLTATSIHGSSRGHGNAALTGTGDLTGTLTGQFTLTSALSGAGTLAATWIGTRSAQPTVLSGTGTLSLSGVTLKYPAALAGTGTLSVLQATGGVVFASPGAAIPQAYPGSSQVAVAAPGSSNWMYLGSIGAVTALTYSFTCPGGADKLTATVMAPATYRTQMFNPGWQVRVTRGGHIVWTGRLDEPIPSASGWALTAVGDGNRGQDFLALYTSSWPYSQPDEAINQAIARGLPWTNPGIGSPSGAWFGQPVDSGGQTVTALLNLVCTRGGLTWYANSQPGGQPGTDISVFPLPTVPNRLLIVSDAAPRTLGGDINTIVIRYQASADTGGGTATYGTVTATNAASVAAHGVIETFVDLSDVGTQSSAAAKAVGTSILAIYQRASFTQPISGHYGDLLTMGGVPIDPGTDQAATCCRAVLCDYGYGGEVAPGGPIQFVTGAYAWDDYAQVFTITPMVTLDSSLSGMLSAANTVLKPITAAG